MLLYSLSPLQSQIGHAGDGGLYAELVQDRSFDALAHASGFALSDVATQPVDLEWLRGSFHGAWDQLATAPRVGAEEGPVTSRRDALAGRNSECVAGGRGEDCRCPVEGGGRDKIGELRAPIPSPAPRRNDVIIAWAPLPGTKTALTRLTPLNPTNTISMLVTSADSASAGVVNHGYWGIHIERGAEYTLSLHARAAAGAPVTLRVALMDSALNRTFAAARLEPVSEDWARRNATLRALESSISAVLVVSVGRDLWGGELCTEMGNFHAARSFLRACLPSPFATAQVSFDGPGSVALDVVSLFPLENVEKAAAQGDVNPWPFRADLLKALKALKPG